MLHEGDQLDARRDEIDRGMVNWRRIFQPKKQLPSTRSHTPSRFISPPPVLLYLPWPAIPRKCRRRSARCSPCSRQRLPRLPATSRPWIGTSSAL